MPVMRPDNRKKNMSVVFYFGPFAPLYENMRLSTDRKYIMYCIAVRGGLSRATVRGNTYREFGEIWACGIKDMRADRQTDKHTATLIAILYTPIGDVIKIKSSRFGDLDPI